MTEIDKRDNPRAWWLLSGRLGHALTALMVLCAGNVTLADTDSGDWQARCTATGVVLCLALDNEASIAPLRYVPEHLNESNRIQYDASMNAARLTIPPFSPAAASGSLNFTFPDKLDEVYASFDIYHNKEFLDARFVGAGGWKTFVLGQGEQGCAPYEVVGVNGYYADHPQFYYICGKYYGVIIKNPTGDNPRQVESQPGADTSCLRYGDTERQNCATFVPDKWVTYQIHVSAPAKWLEVWMTVEGSGTRKIIDFPLDELPEAGVFYEWLKLTPYLSRKNPREDHPEHHIWYRRIVISTDLIPHPVSP